MAAQPLPPRPNLEQLKRQAKELLKKWRAMPSAAAPAEDARLRDAQRAIAQQYGFASWDALRQRVEQVSGAGVAGDPDRGTRRGLEFEHFLRVAGVVLRGDVTRESARALAERRVTGAKIDRSVAPKSLVHLAAVPTLGHIDLSDREDLTDRDLSFLETMPWLADVCLANCRSIGDAGVEHLRSLQNLEGVNLQWTAAGDGAVGALAGKPSLHRLALGSGLTDAGVERLREFPAFRAPGEQDSFLAVSSSTTLTDRALMTLGDLAGVVALDVHHSVFGSQHYTARGVAHLQRMASLEELNFLGDLATDDVLRQIAGISRLRVLMCQDMTAGDDGFIALGSCSTLESIWGRECDFVSDRGFEALARLRRLRTLALGGRRIRDGAMAALVDLPVLADLQPVLFGDEAFRFIARMARLEKLTNMYNRDTTDGATRYLRGHERLLHYGAHGTQIADDSLRILADLPALERAEFENCDRITDAGLMELARASHLRSLSVGSCVNVRGTWRQAARHINTEFDPADSTYVEQYRFWTLLDYPDLSIEDLVDAPRCAVAGDLLQQAVILGCRAACREDGLQLSVDGRPARVRRVGVMTRQPFAVPLRIELMANPVSELRLSFGPAELVLDRHGMPGCRRTGRARGILARACRNQPENRGEHR